MFVYIEFKKCFENVVRKLMNAIEIFCSLGIFTNNVLFWYLSTLIGCVPRTSVPPH